MDATKRAFHKIIQLVVEAAEVARSVGIPNLLQPGLIKELIIADILGHHPITSKRDADTCDPNDPSILYEYLSCKEGGSARLDRMFKEPLVNGKSRCCGSRETKSSASLFFTRPSKRK